MHFPQLSKLEREPFIRDMLTLAPFVRWAIVKALLGPWCTFARMHGDHESLPKKRFCLFCEGSSVPGSARPPDCWKHYGKCGWLFMNLAEAIPWESELTFSPITCNLDVCIRSRNGLIAISVATLLYEQWSHDFNVLDPGNPGHTNALRKAIKHHGKRVILESRCFRPTA